MSIFKTLKNMAECAEENTLLKTPTWNYTKLVLANVSNREQLQNYEMKFNIISYYITNGAEQSEFKRKRAIKEALQLRDSVARKALMFFSCEIYKKNNELANFCFGKTEEEKE